MIDYQCLGEAPLCSAPFRHYLDLRSNMILTSDMLAGKIFTLDLENDLFLTQDEVAAQSLYIDSTIALNQTIVCNGVYNIGISSVVNLVSNEDPKVTYTAAVQHPIFLSDHIVASYIYGIEVCHNIALMQRFGWVIDLSLSNTLNLTMKEMDTLFNDLHLQQLMTTNMDDLSCINPFGSTGDKGLSNKLVITQSLDAKFVYACTTQSQLEILATLAWR